MKPFEAWTQQQKQCYWDNLTAWINQDEAFNAYSHITINKIALDYCQGELEAFHACQNLQGAIHGGCLLTLADTVGGCAAESRGCRVVTLDCSYSYLRPATGRKIHCLAKPVKIGHTISVYNTTLTNDDQVVVGEGTFTYYITGPHTSHLPASVLEPGDKPEG